MATLSLLKVPIPSLYKNHTNRNGYRTTTHSNRRRSDLLMCKCDSTPPTDTDTNTDTNTSVSVADESDIFRGVNRRVAVASATAAAALFVASRGFFGIGSSSLGTSLADLSAHAVPYDQALQNGMPTVVEFYADWCEVCRELAPDVYKVEQEFKDQVNFVMLNVDNSKWEEEVDEFGVEGIPHFAFLDKEGNEKGNVVGKIPKRYLKENVVALARGDKQVPYTDSVGQFSTPKSKQIQPVVSPRAHGATDIFH